MHMSQHFLLHCLSIGMLQIVSVFVHTVNFIINLRDILPDAKNNNVHEGQSHGKQIA